MSANLLKVLLKNQATFSAKLTEVQRRGLNKPLRNAVWLDSGNFPNSWEFGAFIGTLFGSLGNSQNPLKSGNLDLWYKYRFMNSKTISQAPKMQLFRDFWSHDREIFRWRITFRINYFWTVNGQSEFIFGNSLYFVINLEKNLLRRARAQTFVNKNAIKSCLGLFQDIVGKFQNGWERFWEFDYLLGFPLFWV